MEKVRVFCLCVCSFIWKFIYFSFLRLAYSIWILDGIVQAQKTEQIFVMYDIACTLASHLEVIIKRLVLGN